jgi:peptidoglycan glycosyltransferase
VNRQIVQLFGLFTLLFAVLLLFTSRWTVFEASSLEDNPDNRRPLIEEQKIPRGLILASDGTVLARSRGEGRGENRTYTRTYPTRGLFAHPVGFSYLKNGRRGLELSRNDDLVGEEDEFESILAGLESRDQEGNDVVTNLDVRGTQAAVAGLAGRKGAVVAIEPQTGKVRVMVSIPEYDSNLIPSQIGQLNRDRENQPLLNRTTQELYPPGSTFKVVTATAALDTGAVKPETVIDGSSPKEISGVPLENAGGESFGPISITDALTNSVNTVWAQVGERIGRGPLVEYMKRFGFYEDPQLDYPGTQMIASGIINGDGDYVDGGFDAGRVAIGQGGLEGEIRAGPLQMAEVAATVANDGRLMKPRLTDRIVRKDGRVKERIEPDLQAVVMKPETAEQLTAMMSRVVEEGTGTAGALAGIRVAGKTGTAEVGANREFTQPWFIAFAPVEDPRMAIAVTVERTSGQGGTVAAPIAKSVLEALLGGGAG